MAIARERDQKHQADMRLFLARTNGGSPEDRAAGFFDLVMGKIQSDPMLHVVTDFGDLEYLLRKIPPELLAENHASDRQFVKELTRLWNALELGRPIETKDFQALMTLMVALHMQRRTMPADHLTNTIDLLREIFIDRLTKKTSQ